jgi:beta-lactamase regulating signal transducer with metallopeptidase domain
LAVALYLIYRFLLREKLPFQYSRFYLLALPVISLIWPLLFLPGLSLETYDEPFTTALPEVLPIQSAIELSAEVQVIPWYSLVTVEDILLVIYSFGAIVMLIRLLAKFVQLNQVFKACEKTQINNTTVHMTEKENLAFSFLGQIVISNSFTETERQHIIEHEQIHLRQKHSWDLLFYEICKVLFWFHPVSFLAQKQIKQIHEYIVDERLKDQTPDYLESLVCSKLGLDSFSLVNPHNQKSMFKKRIAMLSNPMKSKSVKSLLFVLPLLAASLIYTSCTQEIELTEPLAEEYSGPTVVVAGHELPTLQGFQYGLKDPYKDLSQQEINQYETAGREFAQFFKSGQNYNEMPERIKENYFANFHVGSKIRDNVTTVVADPERGNYVLTIEEMPGQEPTYSGNARATQEAMSEQELHDYISLLKGDSDIVIEETIVPVGGDTSNGDNHEVIEVQEIIEEIEPVVPYALIDLKPILQSCESSAESTTCTQAYINTFINENFNVSQFAHLSGRKKIYVRFLIDASGDVTQVKASSEDVELQDEAVRVVSLLPKFIPGKVDGEKVNVVYALPIIFEI